jgi:serine/threonine protein kinase
MGVLCSNGRGVERLSISVSKYIENNVDYLTLRDFLYICTLDKGSFGIVILVRRKSNDRLYAIKLIKINTLINAKKIGYARLERQILLEFSSPFIVKLYHIFESSGRLCYVLDFMQGGNLATHISKNNKLIQSTARFFFAEVIIALEILHSKGFIYRDLKAENVLLDSDGHIKFIDFNLSTTVDDLNNDICGSPEYAAPEVIKGEIHGVEIDFWALGVLLYYMIEGRTPFRADEYYEIFENITSCKYSFTNTFSSEAKDLVSKFLILDPEKRLKDYKIIKNHEFFEGIDWNKLKQRTMESPLKLQFQDKLDLKYFPRKTHRKIDLRESETSHSSGSSLMDLNELSYNSENS